MTRRTLAGAACVVLALAALGLVATHITPPTRTALVLTASGQPRRGGHVTPLPQGAVNINAADVAELETLPGIGAELARRIIEERERSGAYCYPEDLLTVKGIGEQKLSGLMDFIRLD